MGYQIHFPRKILQDETITNKQKNILIYMYLTANADNVCRSSSKQIAENLGYNCYQNVSQQLKLISNNNYIKIIKNPAKKNELWYKLVLPSNKNFIQLDSILWKQFQKQHDLIVEYFKFKNSYYLIRLLKSQNKSECDEFMHAKLGNYNYLNFCEIKENLYNNELIIFNDYNKI